MQLLENHRSTIEVSGGAGWKTVYLAQNMIYQVVVASATASTVFDVSIENAYGDEVFLSQDNIGFCNEAVELPMATAGTVRVLNATVDEVFTYLIVTKVN